MTLHLVHNAEGKHDGEDARKTLAEVAAVAMELHRLVNVCRHDPLAMERLTAEDIAQAKALLAEARVRLARARRVIS
jgi:hypothetical protein